MGKIELIISDLRRFETEADASLRRLAQAQAKIRGTGNHAASIGGQLVTAQFLPDLMLVLWTLSRAGDDVRTARGLAVRAAERYALLAYLGQFKHELTRPIGLSETVPDLGTRAFWGDQVAGAVGAGAGIVTAFGVAGQTGVLSSLSPGLARFATSSGLKPVLAGATERPDLGPLPESLRKARVYLRSRAERPAAGGIERTAWRIADGVVHDWTDPKVAPAKVVGLAATNTLGLMLAGVGAGPLGALLAGRVVGGGAWLLVRDARRRSGGR